MDDPDLSHLIGRDGHLDQSDSKIWLSRFENVRSGFCIDKAVWIGHTWGIM